MSVNLLTVLTKFYDEYTSRTPQKLKIIDAYLTYILLTGIVQFVYCALVGTFPFNSFLSGFISSVGSFILAGMFCNADKFTNNKVFLNFYISTWEWGNLLVIN